MDKKRAGRVLWWRLYPPGWSGCDDDRRLGLWRVAFRIIHPNVDRPARPDDGQEQEERKEEERYLNKTILQGWEDPIAEHVHASSRTHSHVAV